MAASLGAGAIVFRRLNQWKGLRGADCELFVRVHAFFIVVDGDSGVSRYLSDNDAVVVHILLSVDPHTGGTGGPGGPGSSGGTVGAGSSGRPGGSRGTSRTAVRVALVAVVALVALPGLVVLVVSRLFVGCDWSRRGCAERDA